MNWYKQSQTVAPSKLDSVTDAQWQEINDRMVSMGYDFQGIDDVKRIFNKLFDKMETFPDHKKVFDAVVSGKEYISKPDPKQSRNVFNRAVRYFGLTTDLKEAGYILPNGTMLDLSGKNRGMGTGAGRRNLDHREVGHIMNMHEFVELGAIRHFPELPGVDIRIEPTRKQLEVIGRDVDSSGSGYSLEIKDPKRGRLFKGYDVGVKDTKVVYDILRFYGRVTVSVSQNWYRLSAGKMLYIMRGLSGSGKSSLAQEKGRGGKVFSTDDFFMIDGEYRFDPTMLSYAHLWNQAHAIDAMKKGVSPIVIDNVNSQAWEAKEYVEAGLKYGYQIEFVEPNTPWKFDAEELAKRNKHGVPKEVIEKKLQEWEPDLTIEGVLQSQRPPKEIKTVSGANWYQMHKLAADIETGSVEQFLKGMVQIRSGMQKPEGFHYSCPEEFILQNGKHYASSPLTAEEMGVLKKLARTTCRYKMKECFYNAQHLATMASGIKYVEGYLYSGIIPLEHGWNTINGKVIDFTMYHQNGGKPILGEIPAGWDYFGVEMSTGSVRKYWSDHGESSPLITNWQEGYPLLQKKFEPEQEVEDELV